LYIKRLVMRKQILFVLALLASFSGFSQEVKLTHNLPSSATPGQTIDAEYTVTKGSIGAFAKFQCDLPAGYTAVNGDSKSGNFTFENNRVKIVWVSLPGEATFAFNFKITIPSSASGVASIGGQFYYLENNVKKEFDVPAQNISLGEGSVAATPTETKPAETTTTPTETTSTPTETKPAETTSTPVETTSTPTPVETKTTPVETKTPSRSGVTYYIQVAALSSEPGGQYKKYGKTKVVQENGMYKVLVGNYNSVEEARKHKPEMTSKGAEGCFVVGYENGVRIKL
jgi:cell division septation protein DedD